MTMPHGSLYVVGTGIQAPGQITLETVEAVKRADKVFYLVPDPFAKKFVTGLNENAEDLHHFYVNGQPRIITYDNMVDRILSEVRAGKRVVAAFYGHPGVFAYPSHKAIHVARSEGFTAHMLAGVSAEDCIVSDLGLDPSIGCHSYEATSFMVRPVPVFTSCMLILWQVGVIGDLKYTPKSSAPSDGMKKLQERLLEYYPEDHDAIMYEASFSPAWKSRVDVVPISELGDLPVNGISTLVIPPSTTLPIDREIAAMIGIEASQSGQSTHSTSLKLYRGVATNRVA
ncbi:SAM-dependent methyltransferase [[Pseudomonas] boreopolis]|uniref:SAM-dependent methyltransferase n=1 Tax=Xanthomonas boreopolis TaxID=86183 RepID=UPI003D38582D